MLFHLFKEVKRRTKRNTAEKQAGKYTAALYQTYSIIKVLDASLVFCFVSLSFSRVSLRNQQQTLNQKK